MSCKILTKSFFLRKNLFLATVKFGLQDSYMKWLCLQETCQKQWCCRNRTKFLQDLFFPVGQGANDFFFPGAEYCFRFLAVQKVKINFSTIFYAIIWSIFAPGKRLM